MHPVACRTGFRFEATGVPSSGAGTGPSEKALAHLGMGAKGKKGRERIHDKSRNGASPQIPGPRTQDKHFAFFTGDPLGLLLRTTSMIEGRLFL